ncbi:MAG: hypothetical protein R3E84_04050, partial [Pseudomonadales bacterium]
KRIFNTQSLVLKQTRSLSTPLGIATRFGLADVLRLTILLAHDNACNIDALEETSAARAGKPITAQLD